MGNGCSDMDKSYWSNSMVTEWTDKKVGSGDDANTQDNIKNGKVYCVECDANYEFTEVPLGEVHCDKHKDQFKGKPIVGVTDNQYSYVGKAHHLEPQTKFNDGSVEYITTHPELDPNGIKPNEPGAKLDSGKVMASLLADFGNALTAVAELATIGAKKYSKGGWQHVENGIDRYDDAMWRHLLKDRSEVYDIGDGGTNMHHHVQVCWNALAKLELMIRDGLDIKKGD